MTPNPVKRFFDRLRPLFEKDGRMARLHAFFEAMETVFFLPGHKTQAAPHIRDGLDVKRFMFFVIVAMMPCLFFGIFNAGYQSRLASGLDASFVASTVDGLWIVLPIIVVTYVVGFFWEIVFAAVRGHTISEGLFVSCMIFPLTLPPTTPLWQVALGISFGIVIGKEIFGGTGRNFLNPAMTGRAFLYFAYPVQMSGDAVWTVLQGARDTAVDAFTAATPLAISASAQAGDAVGDLLTQAGYTFSALAWGLYPGGIGATSAVLCLVGAVFLVAVRIASHRIIIGSVAGVLLTAGLLNLLAGPDSRPFLSINPFDHLVMGGFAFAAAFIATEPVTAPDTDAARWIYGFLIGALTVVIRVFNPAFPEGVMLAVLFMNVFAPLMDEIVVKARIKKRIPNV